MREHVYKVCCTKNDISFYLWLIGSVLKRCKVLKYYDQNCLKTFFLLFTPPIMIETSAKKKAPLVQKV